MKLVLFLMGATALATPALAQHSGHVMPSQSAKPAEATAQPDPHAGHDTPADPACPPEHAAMGHCTPAKPTPSDPHAGHQMGAQPGSQPATDPACPPEHAAMGHCTPAKPTQPDPHAGHGAPAPTAHGQHTAPGHEPGIPNPPVAPPPPAALSGPAHAADTIFGTEAMRAARDIVRREHGAITTYNVLIDQMEARIVEGRNGYFVNAQAWYGGDIDRLWVKTEIESDFGRRPEQAEVQALWSHALDPWFNLQAGIRYDFEPNPERAHAVLGIQGLAPYWFEVDGAFFLSDKGDLTARLEAEYDQRITQKLILQPRMEVDFAFQDIPEIGVGSGFSTAEVGLRLRYEFAREFAPYIGVEYNRAFGDTADFLRAEGEKVDQLGFVVGLRVWF